MRKLTLTILGGLLGLWVLGERGQILRPSTRRLLAAAGGRRAIFDAKFWEAYVYGRWTNQYIGWAIKYIFPRVKPIEGHSGWAPNYHGKVLRIEDAKQLISVAQDIPRQTLEQVIPYETAREIVLQGPPAVAAYECGCRSARENPCQPTQVCMVVGQPFVDFVVEHNPQSARRLTTQEALDLLQAEHERGHLHAAYFKDVMLNRFYAICNCCGCCCGGIEAMTQRGVPMVISSGYVAQIDDMSCIACGTCEEACPFDAIAVNGSASVDAALCMGCGICESQCTEEAITLVRDASKPAPLTVQHLLA